MAYYEFECEKCGKQFSVKQSFREHDQEPQPKCPHCGSRKVGQLISAIHVKTAKKS
jgi:putative FmdB family regulatory protein